MSIEISLITSILASALNSKQIAESLVQIFKEKVEEKKTEDSVSSDSCVSSPRVKYLTTEQQAEIVTDSALEALNETYQFTSVIVAERMRQAKLAFNTALSLMTIGVLIIFVGIALLWLKKGIEAGLITVAIGSISEIISLLVFRFNKETNNRLDVLRKDLSVIEVARVGLSMAKQIEDQEKRDQAISELSLKLQDG